MQKATVSDGIVVRELANVDERDQAVRLQLETWGEAFTERVPAAILLVGQRLGGVSAGAFDPNGTLLGFVFGLTGPMHGRLAHWSDMLAVRPEARGRHIGQALKHYQRDRCRALGVERMYWTFDPFVARNAKLNLCRLGAYVAEFVPDMYGTQTGSRVHGALGTDRFVVAWPVSTEPVPLPSDVAQLAGAVPVAGPPGTAPAPDAPLPGDRRVAVRVPADFLVLLDGDRETAREWRMSARRAFLHYLPQGYRVSAFVDDGEGGPTYVLARSA